MKLLAFETSTEACSVALYVDGQTIERHQIAPRRHAELALPWAEALLTEAGIGKRQLDAIALGRGPGAFTGVRLAIAVAQGIAMALDKPVVPVSTLQALATQALRQPSPSMQGKAHILAAIDARMGEIYVAAYEGTDGVCTPIAPERVIAPQDYALPDADGRWLGVGTGFAAADGILQQRLQRQLTAVQADALPHAADIAVLAAAAFMRGEAIAPERVEPTYLRNNVALTLEEQKALRASR